jgi:hypothetical protein
VLVNAFVVDINNLQLQLQQPLQQQQPLQLQHQLIMILLFLIQQFSMMMIILISLQFFRMIRIIVRIMNIEFELWILVIEFKFMLLLL